MGLPLTIAPVADEQDAEEEEADEAQQQQEIWHGTRSWIRDAASIGQGCVKMRCRSQANA
jgi:hypothetical protein